MSEPQSTPGTAVTYRIASAGDASAIAALHAESWRSAYRGMFPDDFLDNHVFAERAAAWSARLNSGADRAGTLTLLAELNGDLAGFAHTIAGDDETYGALLDNLHVSPQAKRLGIGTRLMAETAAWLDGRGEALGMYLWVLQGNAPARLFYETVGGQAAGEGVSSAGGSSSPSLRFWWPQLRTLIDRLPANGEPVTGAEGPPPAHIGR